VNIAIQAGTASGAAVFAAKAGTIIGERASEPIASRAAAKFANFLFCTRFTFIALVGSILFFCICYTLHFEDSKEAYFHNHANNAIYVELLHDVHNVVTHRS
jgi:hypothetical protein